MTQSIIQRIRPSQLNEWFEQNKNNIENNIEDRIENNIENKKRHLINNESNRPILLDVRETWELETAQISDDYANRHGFDVVRIEMRQIPEQLSKLNASAPIACLCHHGMRSLRVALFLEHQGFKRLANIEGGIDSWTTEVDSSVLRY